MPETIVVTLQAEVASGPTVKANLTFLVEAYDKLSVAIPQGATALEVDLQPAGAGSTRLLLVTASEYGEGLSYTVNAETAVRALDQPHLLTGAGAVAMLDPAPSKLSFANDLGSDAQVEILIGRDATP